MASREKELVGVGEAEARSRVVMETISDAVLTINDASTILFANRGASKIFGYGAEELVGAKLTMLMPDYLRHVHEAGLARYVETGRRHIDWQRVELPGLHKDGRELTLEVSFGEFVDEEGNHFFTGVARDVSTRKRLERYRTTQYELTRILAEAPTTQGAISGILHAVCRGLGWRMGALWGADPGREVIRRVEAWHAPEVSEEEFALMSSRVEFARGVGLPGRVWAEGAPTWVADIAADESFPRAPDAASAGLHAAFAFPVVVRGKAVGVFEFFSHEAREPDAELLAVMSNIGGQTGQVLERKRAEDERARLAEEIIRIQEAQLEELSTPLVPVAERVIAMPLVGAVDERRAQRMIDTLLRGAVERRAAFAIIDITGVRTVDTHVADTIIRAARSARLLGTEVILTGIRAGAAQTLAGLGIDLQTITVRKSLQAGIAHALERLRGG